MNQEKNQENLLKKASYLRLAAINLAEGMKSGNFRSLYKGQGIEFSGVRDYIRGDDVRSIDWNVTARMGTPYVKIFEEDRELQIFMIIDSSFSMRLKGDGEKLTKYDTVVQLASLLTLAAEINGCPIGSVFFDGEIYFSCKPQGGRERTMLLLSKLNKKLEKGVRGSVLENAITGAGKLLNKRSLVFVLSDFRNGDYQKPLIRLAQKNDVVAIKINNKMDTQLPLVGAAKFLDVESGYTERLPSSSAAFQKSWKDYFEKINYTWRETCTKHGIMPVMMSVNDDALQVLSSVFAVKSKRKYK